MQITKPTKILIATPLYPPDIGGPATYTKLLEDSLPISGVEVLVVSFTGSRFLPKGLSHLHFFTKTMWAMRSVDVVLAQDTVSVGLPTLCAAKLLRKKCIVRVPGDYAWEQSVQRFGVTETIDDFQARTYGRRVEFLRRLQKWVTQNADAIIAPSNYFKGIISTWGVATEKIHTIYNGVSVPPVSEDMSSTSSYRGRTMVTAGRLVPWKGIAMLISILDFLPTYRLIIVGEGPMQKKLEEQVVNQGVQDRVVFTGSLPRAELLQWCVEADVFVLNTHFESFSFQIVEAMLVGAKIITTSVGSIPELITNGTEGVLLNPDDQQSFIDTILTLETHPDMWKDRAQQAQTKAAQFSVQNTTDGVVSLVTKLLYH